MAHTVEHDWNAILTKRKDVDGATVYAWVIEGRATAAGALKYNRELRPALAHDPARTEAALLTAIEAELAKD